MHISWCCILAEYHMMPASLWKISVTLQCGSIRWKFRQMVSHYWQNLGGKLVDWLPNWFCSGRCYSCVLWLRPPKIKKKLSMWGEFTLFSNCRLYSNLFFLLCSNTKCSISLDCLWCLCGRLGPSGSSMLKITQHFPHNKRRHACSTITRPRRDKGGVWEAVLIAREAIVQ